MSMAMALEGTRDYLRTQQSWTNKQCGIQYRARPPAIAAEFYVALDDAGVATQADNDYYVRETYTMEVGVWRRMRAVPADYSGQMQLETDLYRATVQTLTKLERALITELHMQTGPRTSTNTDFSLPDATLGDVFSGMWVYQGRTGNETHALESTGGTVDAWLGRRLRFRGLRRVQRIESMG